MPHWIEVILLGIIEGVTEFLPVSSTGHLLLAENLGITRQQSDLFNVVIQCGAVLAVIVVFSGRVRGLVSQWQDAGTRDYLSKLAAAFFLTGAGGLVLEKTDFKLPDEASPIAWATLIGGLLIFGIERWLRGRPMTPDITWAVALSVGAAQLLAAIFPGASRSGTTILMALVLGASRPAATEFSFLLGIPTLLAAGGLKIFKALRHGGASEDWALLALGTGVAALTAFLVVKWLLRYVQTHTFVAFGWYRIVLGVGILAVIWLR